MGFDPITVVNFVLSIIIFVLGIALYGRKKNVMTLYIGIAFGLFAISHLATLFDLASTLTVPLIVDRAIAYIVVILALLTFWKK
jgi:predicted membrane channel-forming protein YqfA (hemolysin III family)